MNEERMVKIPKCNYVESMYKGKRVYQLPLKGKDFLKLAEEDPYKPELGMDDPENGYNRNANRDHYREGAEFIAFYDGWFYTSVILNSREAIYKDGNGALHLKYPLYLTDGNHRRLSVKEVIERNLSIRGKELTDDIVEMIKSMPIFCNVTDGFDKIQEKHTYTMTNSKQKGMASDIARAQLNQIWLDDPSILKITPKDYRFIVGQKVAEELTNDTLSPWFDRIKLPNQEKYTQEEIRENPELIHRRILGCPTFLNSIECVFMALKKKDVNFDGYDTNEKVGRLSTVLHEFWIAIEDFFGEEEFKNSKKYHLQKSSGSMVLNKLLSLIIPKVIQRYGVENLTSTYFMRVMESIQSEFHPDKWISKNKELGIEPGEYARGNSAGEAGQIAQDLFSKIS